MEVVGRENQPTKCQHFIFEMATLLVSSVLLLMMFIFTPDWWLFYTGYVLLILTCSFGIVAIKKESAALHIPTIIGAILSFISFLGLLVLTIVISASSPRQNWDAGQLLICFSFLVLWVSVSLAHAVRHILLFKAKRAPTGAEPMSYKTFGA